MHTCARFPDPRRILVLLAAAAWCGTAMPAYAQLDLLQLNGVPSAATEPAAVEPVNSVPAPSETAAAETATADAGLSVAEPADTPPALQDLPALDSGKGAEAWYYSARKAESAAGGSAPAPSAEYIEFQYFLAFSFGAPAEAKEAGKALIRRYRDSGRHALVQQTAAGWMDYFGPDWDAGKALYDALTALGNHREALESILRLKKNLPSAAKARPTEFSYYENRARAALGDNSWIKAALAYLDSYTVDAWMAKSLRLAADSALLSRNERELALLRADFAEKKYDAAASRAVSLGTELYGSNVARHIVSEAGRSFVNSGKIREGIAFFEGFFPDGEPTMTETPPNRADAVATALAESGFEDRLWVAAYYLARLWHADSSDALAAILFLALTEDAPSPGDSDGALWFWLDITIAQIRARDMTELGPRRSLEYGALVEASQRWRNSSSFDDIIETYNRTLLLEKSWNDVPTLVTLLRDRLSPGLRTKLVYQSARLVEEGLAEAPGGGYIRLAFESIVNDTGAEEFYRTMSAWRLGIDPPFLASIPELKGRPPFDTGKIQFPDGESLTLFTNYLAYDLEDLAAAVASKYLGTADKTLIAGLAFQLSLAGEHNMALRLARDAIARGAGAQYPDLYGLMYPKAWNDIVARMAEIPAIPEALAYGIIRSESVFDPKVVSYAGAVGLAQLMPATAAETAKGLKMPYYSLTDPADNLRIGMTYYSYMLSRFGGKPMRAMFAYNAGPGRMSTWNKESGELPDDILIDTLHLAQPRQYAKNIIQASLAYGKIHYGIASKAMLDYLVKAVPIPTGPPPEPALMRKNALELIFGEKNRFPTYAGSTSK